MCTADGGVADAADAPTCVHRVRGVVWVCVYYGDGCVHVYVIQKVCAAAQSTYTHAHAHSHKHTHTYKQTHTHRCGCRPPQQSPLLCCCDSWVGLHKTRYHCYTTTATCIAATCIVAGIVVAVIVAGIVAGRTTGSVALCLPCVCVAVVKRCIEGGFGRLCWGELHT